MTFVAHETLHGAVVRGKRARLLVGWIAFLPFVLSPRLWIAWHNKVHHAHTMEEGHDPDSYPTLAEYERSALLRLADKLSLGGTRVFGLVTLLIGFNGQSLQCLLGASRREGWLTPGERRLAYLETLSGVALWTFVAWYLGGARFFFAYVVPLMIGNSIIMAHILTNHSLSPMTAINDPLLNSLSVTAPRPVEAYTLNFGLHVEHHLFPSMSSRYAPKVRDALVRHWPERYQSMPIWRALRLLFVTGRVYKDATTLYDPATGREDPALAPRETPAAEVDAAA
jgi:fatty acid desaturase